MMNRIIKNRNNVIPFLGLVVAVVFFQVTSGGRLISGRNSVVLLNEVFNVVIGASGVLFLMAQGDLDFSMGAIVGLSGTIAAIAANHIAGLALPVALITGFACGAVNGLVCAGFGIPSFITTLGMSFVLKGFMVMLLGSGSMGIPFELNEFDTTPIRFFTMLAVILICWAVFGYSRFGKQCSAVGSHATVARQAGINVFRTRFLGFAISGLACGLVSFFSIIRGGTVSTSTGSGFEVNVLNAMMIGGMSITGGWNSKYRYVVIGSLLMAVVSDGLSLWGIDLMTQELIMGCIFIFAVAISFDRRSVAVIK
jgi:ribose transport system permease protein